MRFVIAALAILAGLGSSAADESSERALLHRIHPTDVRWGEIAVAEGPAITVPPETGETTGNPPPFDDPYPKSLVITCTRRERREAPGATDRASVRPVERVGAIYLAARVKEGDPAWDRAVDRISHRVASITPETFGSFAQEFQPFLVGKDAPIAGTFSAVYCLSVEGHADVAGAVRVDIEPESHRQSSSTQSDSRPWCAALAGALEGVPAAETMATPFDVASATSERLTLRTVRVASDEPSPWPEGASRSYAPAPDGATAYWRWGTENDESYYAGLRPGRRGGPEGTDRPHVLETRTRRAEIPIQGLDRDTVLLRWRWTVSTMPLGIEPDPTPATTVERLDAALLFTAPHGPVDVDAFARDAATAFDRSHEPPGAGLLRILLPAHLHSLGTDDVALVLCDPASPAEATYCVARACSRVSNGESFCAELDRRLE